MGVGNDKDWRTGGQILVDALIANNVRKVFGVPGESYLAALDAFFQAGDAVQFVTTRHEGGAGFMALAHSELGAGIGVCFVTRGPGATNAAIAIHSAHQAASPLLLLVGQISTANRDRDAFQEVHYQTLFGDVAKWVAEIDDAGRIGEYVSRAMRVAISGRPGPVVLVFPENILTARSNNIAAFPFTQAENHPSPDGVKQLEMMLKESRRPLLLLGGTCWSRAGLEHVTQFSDRHGIPVAVGFRRQGLFSARHPHYIGSLGLGGPPSINRYLEECDLLIALNSRLNDPTTGGYSLLEPPKPHCSLVHILPDGESLGRLYQPDLAIVSGPDEMAKALANIAPTRQHYEICQKVRQEIKADILAARSAGPIDMREVMTVLNTQAPADMIVTTGAGNATLWLNQFHETGEFFCAAGPVAGAMGMGVPAAIAAKILHPDRPCLYLGGDGDFLMTGQELATAILYRLNPIFLIVDNGLYGTIQQHQQRSYPGHPYATGLRNPDFAALARSYGVNGERIERTEQLAPAFARALASEKATVMHLHVGHAHVGPEYAPGP